MKLLILIDDDNESVNFSSSLIANCAKEKGINVKVINASYFHNIMFFYAKKFCNALNIFIPVLIKKGFKYFCCFIKTLCRKFGGIIEYEKVAFIMKKISPDAILLFASEDCTIIRYLAKNNSSNSSIFTYYPYFFSKCSNYITSFSDYIFLPNDIYIESDFRYEKTHLDIKKIGFVGLPYDIASITKADVIGDKKFRILISLDENLYLVKSVLEEINNVLGERCIVYLYLCGNKLSRIVKKKYNFVHVINSTRIHTIIPECDIFLTDKFSPLVLECFYNILPVIYYCLGKGNNTFSLYIEKKMVDVALSIKNLGLKIQTYYTDINKLNELEENIKNFMILNKNAINYIVNTMEKEIKDNE